MEWLTNCVVIMVIGLTVLTVGWTLIQKIFEENRKSSKESALICGKIFEGIAESMKQVANSIREKEDKKWVDVLKSEKDDN